MLSLSFKSIIFLNLNILAFFQEIHLDILFSTKEFILYQTHDYVSRPILYVFNENILRNNEMMTEDYKNLQNYQVVSRLRLTNNAGPQLLIILPTWYNKTALSNYYTALNNISIAEECLPKLYHGLIFNVSTNEFEQTCNWLKLCPQLAMKTPTNTHLKIYIFYNQNDNESTSELKEITSSCHPWEIKFFEEKINFFKNKCWHFKGNMESITCDTANPIIWALVNSEYKLKDENGHSKNENIISGNGSSGKYLNNQPLTWTSPFPQPPLHIDPIFEFCGESFDSISLIRGDLFVFKKQYLWRFRERLRLLPGYPIRIKEIFPFPKSFDGIDAAYENPQGNIYFFSGQQIFIYDGNQFLNKWPRTLKDLEIDAATTKIDAGFIWRKNKKTYLFSGTKFWRYNSKTFQMDSGYPKEINHWKGVSYPVDAVIQWKDGVTYFFVGNTFYRFNDKKVHIESGPLWIKEHWFRLSNNIKCHTGYDKHLNVNLN